MATIDDGQAARVSLPDLVGELEILPREGRLFLNRRTGEIYGVLPEGPNFGWEEDENLDDLPDWQRKEREMLRVIESSEDWLPLPDAWKRNDPDIVRRFCRARRDPEQREALTDAFRGRGAFRKFRRAVEGRDLEDEWYSFRAVAIEELAVDWLEENGIPFHR